MTNRKPQVQYLLVILSGVLIVSFLILKPFLATLALASVFAVVLQPLYKKIVHMFGNQRVLATLVTVILSFICILVPLLFLTTQVFHQALQVYGYLVAGDTKQNLIVNTINDVGQTVNTFLPGTGTLFTTFSSNLDIYIKQGLAWLINNLGSAVSGISFIFLHVIIFLISLYYLLLDGSKLKQELIKLSPLDDKDDGTILYQLEDAVNSVIKGSVLVALIHGLLITVLGFTIFGVPNSILWGMVTVITAFIPGIGVAIVQIPAIIYLLVTGHTISALGLTVWGLLVAGFIDNFLRPKLIGRGLKLPPLLILLSILGGILFFGPIGIFLGPLTMSLFFALLSMYSSLIITPKSEN